MNIEYLLDRLESAAGDASYLASEGVGDDYEIAERDARKRAHIHVTLAVPLFILFRSAINVGASTKR